jgi:NapC/NirT cytochrome c family protein
LSVLPRLRSAFGPAVFLAHNPLTLAGAGLTTSAGLTLVGLWFFELIRGGPQHPYAGIVLFLFLPAVFVLGLVLMPLGIWWQRRRLAAKGELPESFPAPDLKSPLVRRGLRLVLALTAVNVAMLGLASYRGVQYMDSTQFCGVACHSVMAPEYAAYLSSPHSRVACVECHIGPGASWFVKAKISGARQVFAVTFGTHSRPIPSPVKELRPARETCEHCHWPQKLHGDMFLVRKRYGTDEKNTLATTVMVLKVGGLRSGSGVGIHGRHLDAATRIEYVSTDDKRQVIPRVSATDAAGKTVEYVSTELKPTPEQLANGERRVMDCVDCHNRPSHTFELPDRAVDKAFAEGGLSVELPFLKKKAVELLKAPYPDRGSAREGIASGLTEYYRTSHPDAFAERRTLIEAAAGQLVAIYERNVFPEMKVGWGTYANNIGHEDFLGCFRCHDDNHKSVEGKTLTQDCESCHTILASEETDPAVLTPLGLGSGS